MMDSWRALYPHLTLIYQSHSFPVVWLKLLPPGKDLLWIEINVPKRFLLNSQELASLVVHKRHAGGIWGQHLRVLQLQNPVQRRELMILQDLFSHNTEKHLPLWALEGNVRCRILISPWILEPLCSPLQRKLEVIMEEQLQCKDSLFAQTQCHNSLHRVQEQLSLGKRKRLERWQSSKKPRNYLGMS
ncbi:Oncoid [Papillomaviridae sp. Seabass_c24797]|nr:Oncoid [Papillomaviridae sp. Seabass_c24797]